MGGGPEGTDTIRTTCLLTFPQDTKCPPVPIDAMYLRALGIRLIKRIGIQEFAKRQVDARPFGVIHQRHTGQYVSVCTDSLLRKALTEAVHTSRHEIIRLHLIYVDQHQAKINVVVGNPYYSPEPVAPTVLPTRSLAATSSPTRQQVPPVNTSHTSSLQKTRRQVTPSKNDTAKSQFYISSSWHLQAERMSLSLSSSLASSTKLTSSTTTQDSDEKLEVRPIPEVDYTKTAFKTKRRPHKDDKSLVPEDREEDADAFVMV